MTEEKLDSIIKEVSAMLHTMSNVGGFSSYYAEDVSPSCKAIEKLLKELLFLKHTAQTRK